jgi:hypothetical protein
MRTRTITSLFLLLALPLSQACDSRADETDLEEQQILFLALQQPSRNTATNNCVPQHQSAIRCANMAGVSQTAYVAGLQTAYNISVPAAADGSTGGPAEICQVYPGSRVWTAGSSSYTEPGKNCHYTCELEYWDDMIEQGRCTAGTYTSVGNNLAGCGPFAWKTTCSVAQMNNCLNACLTQGTVLPQ